MAAWINALAGVLFAYVLFYAILPGLLKVARLPIGKMIGWYIAYAIGYGASTSIADAISTSIFFNSVTIFIGCGALPLIVAHCLTPVGIVGFPTRPRD